MADILIRGMGDIPVGQEFVIVENIDFERYLYNRETGAAFHLISLPEGHGRLIDAEAYVDYMQNRYDNNEITNGDWIDFRLSLKDQPTIVPAEGGKADGN